MKELNRMITQPDLLGSTGRDTKDTAPEGTPPVRRFEILPAPLQWGESSQTGDREQIAALGRLTWKTP